MLNMLEGKTVFLYRNMPLSLNVAYLLLLYYVVLHSLPLLFLMLFMFTQAASRSVGASKNRFVQEEADEWNAVSCVLVACKIIIPGINTILS